MEHSTIWYNYDLSDMKDVIKCVKQIERICRITLEYDMWQMRCKYKDNQDCPICDENYYEKNLKIESHHHPKTLFDIVQEVISENLESNKIDEKTGIDLVQEVMDLHFFDKVSYINLCVHCHKKYHDSHPDVINKMNDIFEKRANEGKEKYEKTITSSSDEIDKITPIGENSENLYEIPSELSSQNIEAAESYKDDEPLIKIEKETTSSIIINIDDI